jgi:hypothetical protein
LPRIIRPAFMDFKSLVTMCNVWEGLVVNKKVCVGGVMRNKSATRRFILKGRNAGLSVGRYYILDVPAFELNGAHFNFL